MDHSATDHSAKSQTVSLSLTLCKATDCTKKARMEMDHSAPDHSAKQSCMCNDICENQAAGLVGGSPTSSGATVPAAAFIDCITFNRSICWPPQMCLAACIFQLAPQKSGRRRS